MNVLAYDLGGTKIAAAIVNDKGSIIESRVEKAVFSQGVEAIYDQLARMGRELMAIHPVTRAGIASAGPLDPRQGVLLDSTNFKTAGQSWGVIPLVKELKSRLNIDLVLDNDAASAALAEHWVGEGKGFENMVAITLGTGVGVGIVANGSLVRAGRNLHTEGGHVIIETEKAEALCGCGNFGCAEAYLSGVNFTKLVSNRWKMVDLTSHNLIEMANSKDERALKVFTEYGDKLATFISNLVMLFAPEVVVLSGGFSHAAHIFLPQTESRLLNLMERHREGIDMLPQIRISKFRDEAGLIGAAKVALTPI